MNQFTLTKEEFITRAMAGEVFLHKNNKLFYDPTKEIPFRYDIEDLDNCWSLLDGKHLFTLEQPKPCIERRWKWRKDNKEITNETSYVSDNYATEQSYQQKGWYKAEDCFIDVEIKS